MALDTPGGSRGPAGRPQPLAGTVGAVVTGVMDAAAPSPFPPIADYAFLSNCHTGALVAADGSVEWLCVPRFDAPSVFGSLLDREAGRFRFGPYGMNHPVARTYLPGTNVLETTWRTPTGRLLVTDALTMGPHGTEDAVTPRTRPPADQDADHMLVRTARCLDGRVEVELICEPGFDYGRTPAQWRLPGGDRHTAEASGADRTIALRSDLAMGVEVTRVRARRELMERLLRVASPLGLYAEEFEVDTGRHLGNFPQAFSHLALIEAAGRIILAERLEEIS